MLAMHHAQRWMDRELRQRSDHAIERGVQWLRKLQNRDGGWPTFCRGWGKLPFDRSSNDLTAHAMRALVSVARVANAPDRDAPLRAKAAAFLEANQQQDGSWLPLWFGNQDFPEESNPIYGTSRVLVAAATGILSTKVQRRGFDFLVSAQNADGGWGGGPSVTAWMKSSGRGDVRFVSSVEETALAVDALTTGILYQRNLGLDPGVASGCRGGENSEDGPKFAGGGADCGTEAYRVAIIRGVEFLLESVQEGRHRVPWPISFYFAKLWYHERLYPLIFATTALGKYLRATAEDFDHDWPR
jgi:squalene-hopene/tetraprenyl-beta-curcumene cyclase